MSATYDRLLTIMFTDEELGQYVSTGAENMVRSLTARKAWVKTEDLAVPDVVTEKMALIHLLYFQSIGRVVVEDIDPESGAVLLHLGFSDVL